VLAAAIASAGAVLSQFPAATRPLPFNFPLRNRVLAGLALAVVVVEAAERSGALITAGLAGELGREVMAVPGRVTSPASRGCHRLLRDGAVLVESWEDVVGALAEPWRRMVAAAPARPARVAAGEGAEALGAARAPALERVLRAMADEPLDLDAVSGRAGVPAGEAAAVLLALELDGRVRQLAGSRFVRAAGA
jgi:DNA processing protein